MAESQAVEDGAEAIARWPVIPASVVVFKARFSRSSGILLSSRIICGLAVVSSVSGAGTSEPNDAHLDGDPVVLHAYLW